MIKVGLTALVLYVEKLFKEKKYCKMIVFFVAIGTVHLDFFVNDAVAEPGHLGEDVAAAESLMTGGKCREMRVCVCVCVVAFFGANTYPAVYHPSKVWVLRALFAAMWRNKLAMRGDHAYKIERGGKPTLGRRRPRPQRGAAVRRRSASSSSVLRSFVVQCTVRLKLTCESPWRSPI